METSEIWSSAVGAVIGFALAEFVSGTKLAWGWLRRPRLAIVEDGQYCILSDAEEVASGQLLDREIYGFDVRNAGRRIATNVRFQLLKVEGRDKGSDEFHLLAEGAYDLSVFRESRRDFGSPTATLVPGAQVTVELAKWREDHFDALMPAIREVPPYFEESCQGVREFRFTVAVFDDEREFKSAVLSVRPFEKAGA